MKISIDNLFIELPIQYKEALKAIELNGLGIIFFINDTKKLIGSARFVWKNKRKH